MRPMCKTFFFVYTAVVRGSTNIACLSSLSSADSLFHAGNSTTNNAFDMQMIDFGLADFREVFGAGYVTGKHRSLIHNEPHRVEPLRGQNSIKGSGQGQQGGKEEGAHHHLKALRGNKGIAKRADAVPKGIRVSKFFPTPAGLIPQVTHCIFSIPHACMAAPPVTTLWGSCILSASNEFHLLALSPHCLSTLTQAVIFLCCSCESTTTL